ncbi:MAG: sugar phosphate isomerase/epimerase [Kiritimatiellae bacterium]|nr:sugar phosphate isomerase/epimerase [Kiritimatiellia bacterium]
MKLSVCTIGLRDRKADEAFRVMAQCGYFYADCLAYSPTAHVNRSMNAAQRKAVAALAAKHGVKICSLAGSVGDTIASENLMDRQKAVKEIKDEVDLAVDLGAKLARVSSGGEVLAPILERAVPHFEEAAGYAQSKGVRLVVENHGGSISAFPTQMAALCQAVDSSAFGIIYEPGNLMGIDIDYKAGFELMQKYIYHVHLKDGYAHYFGNDGFAPHRLFCTLFGEGRLDIPWVMEHLKSAGYNDYVSVEYEGCWHPECKLPATEKGLRQAREFMAPWFPLT